MLKVKLLTDTAKLPTKANPLDAGYDLYCDESFQLSGTDCGGVDYKVVSTGIAAQGPEGTYLRVAEKSGLAAQNIKISGGVVDRGYTDEIKVIVQNFAKQPRDFEKGQKIAQLIIEKIEMCGIIEVEELDETERGSGGFGSTGDF